MVGDFGPVTAVHIAGIAYKHRLFLNNVSALSMGGAWIDGVFVIQTSAD